MNTYKHRCTRHIEVRNVETTRTHTLPQEEKKERQADMRKMEETIGTVTNTF